VVADQRPPRLRFGRNRLGRLSVLWLCVFGLTNLKCGDAAADSTPTVHATAAPENACNAAFEAIIKAHMDPGHWDQYMSSSLTDEQDSTVHRYDTACLRGIADAKDRRTQPFIRDIVGALGFIQKREFSPFCSGFRVAASVMLTAKHCWCAAQDAHLSELIFRVIEAPASDLTVRGVIGSRPLCSKRDDYSDVVLLDIDGTAAQFGKSRGDFEGALVPGEQIAIFGFDYYRFKHLASSDPTRWKDAIVFSPYRGSQKADRSWLWPTPSDEQYTKCLYYRAPTYPGMSGALILGAESEYQPHAGRLFVAGMHFRAGLSNSNDKCGSYMDYNIGLSLPPFGTSFLAPLSGLDNR
jgi:hypothetical protein